MRFPLFFYLCLHDMRYSKKKQQGSLNKNFICRNKTHHQGVLTARVPLTLFRYPFLSAIVHGRSSQWLLVFVQSRWIYDFPSWSTQVSPSVWILKKTLLISSSLFSPAMSSMSYSSFLDSLWDVCVCVEGVNVHTTPVFTGAASRTQYLYVIPI